MKLKLLLFGILFVSINCYGQDLISNDVNDTLSIEKIGKKIELENDFDKCKIWNDQIYKISKARKELKGLHPKIKKYYAISYLMSLITDAFLEDAKGNTKKAISIQIFILKELEKTENKDDKLSGYVYRSMSAAFVKEKEYEKGKYYTLKAIPFAIKDSDKSNLTGLYRNLGFFYNNLKDINKGIFYYEKSLKLAETIKDTSYIASCLQDLSTIYIDNKEYKKAYVNAEQAIMLNKRTNDFAQLAENYLNLNQLLKILKNNQKAYHYLIKAHNAATKAKNLKIQFATTDYLYIYYKKTNQSDLALKYLEEHIAIDKIINKEENKNAMLKAEFQYETEKKEAQIKDLSQQQKISELENKRQKTTLGLLVLGIISALITSFLLFKRYKANKQTELLKSEIAKNQAENQATESELKALKSQMNPHFIFNALNSIQEQFMFGDKLVANEQMGNFTSLTRQILSVSGKKKIPLSLEIDILTKYLELEKMRFEENFEYTISFAKNIDDEYIELPPMLIQPFVENSIKHGLLHKNGNKRVIINFSLNEEEAYLVCTVEDNGIGRKKSEEIKEKNTHKSFSTESISQRLRLLNDKNDSVIYEDLTNEDGIGSGTRVILKIYL